MHTPIIQLSPQIIHGSLHHVTDSSLFCATFHFGKYFSSLQEEESPPLTRGKMYLIKGRNIESSYRLFLDHMADNNCGLIITRKNPSHVQSRYHIKHIPMLWLSQKEEKDVLFPTQLHKLGYVISETVSMHDNPLILLDGLEYLMVHNTFDAVIKQLYVIRDVLLRHGGILLIPLDPEAFSEREICLLEKESISL
jgi:hypothetical protein